MGMQCSQYIAFVDFDAPDSAMLDPQSLVEFAGMAGVVEGVSIGIEIARPDLEGIGQRAADYCRENPTADAIDYIATEIEGD